MRYLVCEDFGKQEVVFLFPDKVDFLDMREQLPYARILSAGDVVFKENTFICSGGSKELNLIFRPADVELILRQFK